ncbi:MAG TPA: hypothetical protein VGC74_01120 [Stenotrophomonas sp.]|jgi:hypothetical protein
MNASALRDLAWLPRSRWRAWLLLVFSTAAVSGALGWTQQRLDQRLQALAATKPVLVPARPAPSAPVDLLASLDKNGAERLNDEVRMLNRDWPALLTAIVPSDRQTRLLSLDVNPANGSLLVTGQAADHAGVSAYTVQLDQSGLLREVRLLSVEGQVDGVVFEVSAQWR